MQKGGTFASYIATTYFTENYLKTTQNFPENFGRPPPPPPSLGPIPKSDAASSFY